MKNRSSIRRVAAATGLILCPLLATLAEDWPQWQGPKRDGVWRETGIIDHFPSGGPKVLWRTAIGAGYSGPAVKDGRVYVMDRQLKSPADRPRNPFQRGAFPGTDRVLCLEETTGEVVWTYDYTSEYTVSYPAGPRTTPLVAHGKVYTLGTEGKLFCLDAAGGHMIWSRDLKGSYFPKTPTWGHAASPLLDGDRLICLAGGDGTTAVAFDKDTGKEIWRALSAREPGYCPPIIIRHSGVRQLIIWDPEAINSLNPETGETYWSIPWKIRSGLTIPTPRLSGDELFFTSFYNGATMVRLASNPPDARLIWRSRKASEKDTTELHSIISTPAFSGGYIYGVGSYGQLRCLDAASGKRLWSTFEATTGKEPVRWANAFIVKQDSRYFLFNEGGDLIIANMTPKGYHEIDRAHLLDPTNGDARSRMVVWSHPAFANRHIYARNDKEIIAVSLAKP